MARRGTRVVSPAGNTIAVHISKADARNHATSLNEGRSGKRYTTAKAR